MKDLSIKKLGINDQSLFLDLIYLFEEVFAMKNCSIPKSEFLKQLLKKQDFMVFVALFNNQVVGGLTAYILEQYYLCQPIAYIYDLAVKTQYQRQGVGTQLISAIQQYCQERGFAEMFVQADRVDDYALKFYRSTEPTAEEDVAHFYYSLNQKDC